MSNIRTAVADRAAQRHAVEARQHFTIEEHDVEGCGARALERERAIGDLVNDEAGQAEIQSENSRIGPSSSTTHARRRDIREPHFDRLDPTHQRGATARYAETMTGKLVDMQVLHSRRVCGLEVTMRCESAVRDLIVETG